LQIFDKKLLFIIIFVLFVAFSDVDVFAIGTNTSSASGAGMVGMLPKFDEIKGPADAFKETVGMDTHADELEFIGDNLIAKGNVRIRKGDVIVYSDMAIVNNTTKNIELSGNVNFSSLIAVRTELEYWELSKLQKDPFAKLKVVGTVLTPSGRQKLVVDVIKEEVSWSGERAAGNLKTGIFEFGDFVSKFGSWYALGDHGVRSADGKVVINDATVTPCESILDGLGHSAYSLESARLVAIPPSGSCFPGREKSEMTNEGKSMDNYHFWGYSNLLYIGSIPVLWLPVIYKPPKGDLGKWGVTLGQTTDWGFYAQTTNYWNIVDNSDVSLGITNMIDYYSRRGVALGNQTEMYTKDTQTEFMVYGLMDGNASLNVPEASRNRPIDPFRYGLQLKNISNITDRLSFRGNVAKLSDMYFLYDFFENIARINPQPATYGNINYQFDNASANLAIRPRVNDFFNVVETLPRLDITVPRQELFGNISFQSETSAGYYQMKWAEFKQPRSPGLNDPSNYGTFRLDSVNFMYYPLKLDWLNVIPRAGVRMTVYGNSSSTPVSASDLDNMISVATSPDNSGGSPVNNYNDDGGAKFRVIPEFGVQFNTKISRSWTDVKNAYFDMDGLRHVMEPYVDYTYVSTPTVNRDNLYYFDDIDRIDSQNWVRVGLKNRLQTRRGGWGTSQVYTWASMENYADLIFTDRGEYCGDGWKNLGGLGTKLTLSPYENLNFTMDVLVEGSQLTDFTYLLKAVDKASFIVNWEFAENWGINGSYYFGYNNMSQGVYSMGSNLSTIQAGSVFMRNFTYSSYANVSLNYQINERTTGVVSVQYDFAQDLMPGLQFGIVRALPGGLELMLSLGMSKQNNTTNTGTEIKQNISASVVFSPSANYIISPRENLLPENIVRAPF
jgi:lipopolysaccharide assembly outer membrane protein LptD (OstA)